MTHQGKSKFVPLIALAVDILILIFSFFIAIYFRFGGVIPNNVFYYGLIIGWIFLWFIISFKLNLYEIPRIIHTHRVVSKNLKASLIFAILSGAAVYFLTDYKFSRIFFSIAIISFSFLVIVWRGFFFYIFKKYREKGYNFRNIVIIGINENIEKLVEKVFLNPSNGYKIKGFFTDGTLKKDMQYLRTGALEEVLDFCDKNSEEIDLIVVSLPHHKSDLINKIIYFGDNQMIRVKIIPEFSEYLSQMFSIDYVENIPVLSGRAEPLQSFTNRLFKRGFDVVFSVMVVILLFSWLFPIIAIIIKLTSKGPVFFAQERTGKDGVSFKCLKFRSMTVNNSADEKQATKGDARITPFGAIMRKTSIDELPQILNVIKNDMSLVGPRPHMLKHTDEYRLLVDKFMVRHFAKPGVTGWAQINGFRGETKTVQDMANRAEADIWYIENWSFVLDIKIVFKTAWSMFFKIDDNAF